MSNEKKNLATAKLIRKKYSRFGEEGLRVTIGRAKVLSSKFSAQVIEKYNTAHWEDCEKKFPN